MTLTVALTPQTEAWLNTEAQQQGLPLHDFVRRVIEERVPAAAKPEAARHLTQKNKAVIALMDEWLAKAPTDPEEIQQTQDEANEFMENLNRNRIEISKAPSTIKLFQRDSIPSRTVDDSILTGMIYSVGVPKILLY